MLFFVCVSVDYFLFGCFVYACHRTVNHDWEQGERERVAPIYIDKNADAKTRPQNHSATETLQALHTQ